jgi:hypothetical protein
VITYFEAKVMGGKTGRKDRKMESGRIKESRNEMGLKD